MTLRLHVTKREYWLFRKNDVKDQTPGFSSKDPDVYWLPGVEPWDTKGFQEDDHSWVVRTARGVFKISLNPEQIERYQSYQLLKLL